jgi:dynein heavy chain
VLKSLRKPVPEGDLNALVKVKSVLHDCSESADANVALVQSVSATMHYLHDNGVHGIQMKQLDAMKDLHLQVVDQCPTTTRELVPETKSQAATNKELMKKYNEDTERVEREWRKQSFWDYETGVAASREAIEAAKKELVVHQAALKEKKRVCMLFEFPDAVDAAAEKVRLMEESIGNMTELWDLAEESSEFVADAKELLWSEVHAEGLEDDTKKFIKRTKQLHKDVRWCRAFTGLDKTIKSFLITMPLIQALHHDSMRPRHWQMLKDVTGKAFTPPPEDPNMILQGILDLKLHEHAADVEEIADQAIKEEKIEIGLKKLIEFWEAVNWFSENYKQTDVPLVKMMDDDFEALENDQMIVQGMLASRFIAQFEADVNKWHKELGMVSDILVIFADIQRMWAYLEPLFIGSEEVRKELPETAAEFTIIDGIVKSMLYEAAKTKNVCKACNKPGLLDVCEKQLAGLNKCKKSLNDFLDGRRRQFPRFYFMSEADLLDVLSNGSQPHKIICHTSKMFLAVKTLELDIGPEDTSRRPKVKKWISGIGSEFVMFNAVPVPKYNVPKGMPPLEGKAEVYLKTVVESMKSTLFLLFEGCLDSYEKLERSAWVMGGRWRPDVSRDDDPRRFERRVRAHGGDRAAQGAQWRRCGGTQELQR